MLVTVDLGELERLQEALTAAPEQTTAALNDTAARVAMVLAAGLKASAPVFLGNLVSSIEEEVIPAAIGGGVVAEVYAGVPYAVVQDVGRQPGKWPPDEPIRRWVELKLHRRQIGGKEMSLDSLVFLIRRKIGEHGTKPTHFIDKGMNRAAPAVEAEITALETRVAALLESQ